MSACSWNRRMRELSRLWACRWRDSFHFAQTLYNDYGRPYGQGFNSIVGASMRTEAGPLAFYVRGEYQHSASIAPYSPSTAQAIANVDQLPLNSVPTFNGVNQFNTIEAYAALNMANWQMSFGQQSLEWGPDAGGSLMLSNNARSDAHVARRPHYSLSAARSLELAGHDPQYVLRRKSWRLLLSSRTLSSVSAGRKRIPDSSIPSLTCGATSWL